MRKEEVMLIYLSDLAHDYFTGKFFMSPIKIPEKQISEAIVFWFELVREFAIIL